MSATDFKRLRARSIRPRPLRDWTLSARIVTAVVGLLIVLCLAIGFFTEIALRHFLMKRLDQQLTSAAQRSGGPFRNQDRPATIPPPITGRFDVPINNIFAVLSTSGTGVAYIGTDSTTPETLSAPAVQVLSRVPADDRPRSITIPGHGQYRVSAHVTQNEVLLTGLPLRPVSDTLNQLTLLITALSVIGLIIASICGALIVRLALRPLRRVTATASRVAEMPLDEGEVALAVRVADPNPHTEVGQVGVALNHMLENISDALTARHLSELRVRQFVADASHELRTPLAAIRGYAELTRRSREVAPPDIKHAMGRVESEATRMTALVEDLLLLARLDAGRPLGTDEVDLTRLAFDVLSDAHVAGPNHRWHLDVPDDPVLVTGDEPRLHQVLANLLANARTHTPAGTNVWVNLAVTGPSVVIGVRDDGPGIPPQLAANVFERFSRGEESRSRAAGSTGLGLAIVAAVVTAHGGTITLESRPGHTAFIVTLPNHGNRQARAQTATSLAIQNS